MIAGTDRFKTKRQEKALQREVQEMTSVARRIAQEQSVVLHQDENTEDVEVTGGHDEDEVVEADSSWRLEGVKVADRQNRLHFPFTMKAAMRFGYSSSGVATLATCTLMDLGIVTKEEPQLILDHGKVEIEKEIVMRGEIDKASD